MSFFPTSAYGPAGFNGGAVGQNFNPAADNTYDIGTQTTLDWKNIYFQGMAQCVGGSGTSSGFSIKDVFQLYTDGSNIICNVQNGRDFRVKSATAGTAAQGLFEVDSTGLMTAGAAFANNARIAHFRNNGTVRLAVGHSGALVMTQLASAGTSPSPRTPTPALSITTGAHVFITTATEVPQVEVTGASWQWAGSTTLANQRFVQFGQPTITCESATTVTNAATLYVAGNPVAGTNATITNNYAFWVDAGKARFDGDGTHIFELPADATDPTGGGGAAVGRIPVSIGGATKYIAYY
jgi:hypothetical protein